MIKLLLILSIITLSLAFAEREEASSLLSIKSFLIDPLNHLKDWNDTITHCNWTGVQCNPNGFVERLDLSNVNLSGKISNQIDRLKGLSYLNLSYNGFSSVLPDSLSNLTSLQMLDLSSNNFIGGFPSGLGRASGLKSLNISINNFVGLFPEDLGNATSLEILDFRGSFFEGSVPKTVKNLQKLSFLGLSGNNFSGEIPPELGQLFSLKTLIIGYNEFEGSIPSEFGNLTNLEYLDLAVGSLSGEIPKELGNLKKLTTIYLYQNNFEGKIPVEIGNITSLLYLDFSDNEITGNIPYEITYLENLKLMNLMCNKLSGQVPKGIGELKNLEVLELWQNYLTGPLPENLGRNSPLQWLDVSSNSFSGDIPVGLCEFGNLTKLILFNNSFSSPIPLGLSNCSSLVRVRVQNNLISGMIPIGFGTLPNLQRLELANNNLTGRIPADFFLSPSLAFVDLSNNHLESTLPPEILSVPSLQAFIISNNNLKGNIPDELQDCPSLTVLDLSSNHFFGKIPHSLASCDKLVTLNLRNNQLTGEIPRALSSMPTLSVLDLSHNFLIGEIPASFGSSPALEMLNLSYNNLKGIVPSNGMLMTINPSDLIGNDGLCGGTLPPCSQNTLFSSKKIHVNHIVVGFIVGISVILALGLTFFIGKRVYKRWYLYGSFFSDWNKWNTSEWPWRLTAFQRVNFSSDDIVNCINEANVIGMGANGVVYKAEITRIHSIFAVKKLWRFESKEDLFGEVDLLGRLRHRNIVRLLGYVYNEKDVMMIYEYMPNGNLGEALHGENARKMLVDWVSRYDVATGIAHGLAYLHHDCYPPVIHRDVKSNNILLDENFEARIADFGLARTMIGKNETVSMVAGSYGYIAPEYGYTLKVDEKSDIYSYGVVLLELVTGKLPLDPSFGEYTHIVEWVQNTIKISAAVEKALDPEIAGDCKHIQEEMLLVLKIALLCTAKNPKDRPSMRDVISMLGEAKPRRKSICLNEKPTLTITNSPIVDLL